MSLSGRNRPRGGVSRLLNKPLRRIVGYHRGLEMLECGHEQLEVSDIIGPTNATRRRCRKCPDLERRPAPRHRVERLEGEEWLVVFEGRPADARARFEMAAHRQQRVRHVGARGQVLREN